MNLSLMPDAVLNGSREIGRRSLLSRTRNLAVGGCTAAAVFQRSTPAAAPTASMSPPKGDGSVEAYFIPVVPRARRRHCLRAFPKQCITEFLGGVQ
jgi:hypothetical protein